MRQFVRSRKAGVTPVTDPACAVSAPVMPPAFLASISFWGLILTMNSLSQDKRTSVVGWFPKYLDYDTFTVKKVGLMDSKERFIL